MTGARHRRLLVTVVVLAACAGATHAGFDQAMAYFKAGKHLEAAAEFQALVDRTPGYDYGHYMLGQCFLKMKRPEQAERSFKQAFDLRDDKPEYYHALALAYADQKRYGPALGVLAAGSGLVKDAKTAFAFLSLRGYVLVALQRWSEAAVDLERALSLRRDRSVLDLLGRARFVLGQYEKAAVLFAESLKHEPVDGEVLSLLAESLIRAGALTPNPDRKQGLYERALMVAWKLRALQPGSRVAEDLLGRAALGAGQYALAEEALRNALAAEPGACVTMVNLSRAHVARQRWHDAESLLLDAAKCAPEMAAVHQSLGFVYFRQQRFLDALAAYERANNVRPSVAAAEGIAAARARLGKPARPASVKKARPLTKRVDREERVE